MSKQGIVCDDLEGKEIIPVYLWYFFYSSEEVKPMHSYKVLFSQCARN